MNSIDTFRSDHALAKQAPVATLRLSRSLTESWAVEDTPDAVSPFSKHHFLQHLRFRGPNNNSCREVSRWLVDCAPVSFVCTLLTVFALCGDDIRLLFTDKPADIVFDALVMACIFVFSFEVVLSSIGKKDYFMGFFFGLDVISTGSLMLDLTFVSDALFASNNGFGQARTGQTARLGTKTARVVRVIRLIRIVKLYKAVYERNMRKKKAEAEGMSEADDAWESIDIAMETNGRESLVGQKLSGKMTQSTIVLVLSLLVVLPLLDLEDSNLLYSSAVYGAEDVYEAFVNTTAHGGPRWEYEETLLRYLYYHNWFSTNDCCTGSDPGEYESHNFWVGLAGSNLDVLKDLAHSATISDTEVDTWLDSTRGELMVYQFGTMPSQVVNKLSSNWTVECTVRDLHHVGLSVLDTEIPGVVDYAVRCPTDLRPVESESFRPHLLGQDEFQQWYFVFYFDQRPYVRHDARLSLIMTVYVCFVLCVASVLFSYDANTLVLEPLEQMIAKVEAIKNNLMVATKISDQEFNKEEKVKAQTRNRVGRHAMHAGSRPSVGTKLSLSWWRFKLWLFPPKKLEDMMETVMLEKTIIKLGTLLALGFGEAGAKIVSQNLSGRHAMVNASGKGIRVDCVIGSARIRDFSIANVILQEKITKLVNQIAEIVHGVTDEFHGAPNRNDGESFLIIWRTDGINSYGTQRLAEMSIVAFARMLGAVHRSPVLAEYRTHPGLQQVLGSGWSVNLGFGLHYGWAIEGAVGSEFKIDASYLSPNVNIAATVERATLVYGVCCLVTQNLAQLCTKAMVESMRCIDNVSIQGSKEPMELYSLDLDHTCLKVDEPMGSHFTGTWNTKQRFRSRQLLEATKARNLKESHNMAKSFQESPELAIMCQRYTFKFKQLFNTGYRNYIEGEWEAAREWLRQTFTMLGTCSSPYTDGPSKALLKRMERHGYRAPRDWRGVHDLGSLEGVH